MTVRVEGNLAVVDFQSFDLAGYEMFLRCKKLPEHQLSYDAGQDRYQLTTPARFASMLGACVDAAEFGWLPLAGHLFDYQQWAVEMALSAERFALWLDCVSGDTIIQSPDGDERIDVLAARGESFRVYALDDQGPLVAWAAFAFKKGRAPLYEFALDDGRAIKVTARHRFLTPRGWRAAQTIRPGERLLASEPGHHRSSAALDLSALPPGALYSTRRDADSTDRCASDSRRCGPPLRSAEGSGLTAAPSRGDALALGLIDPRGDGQAYRASRSRRHRSTDRLSMQGCGRQGSYIAAGAESPRESERCTPSAYLPQTADLSPSGWPHWPPSAEPRQGGHPGSRTALPFSAPADVSLRTVVSVHCIGEADYYDMHVPVFENYLANGIWNHNTGLGKTAVLLEWTRQVQHKTGGKVLIICPPGLFRQHAEESARFYGDALPLHRLETRDALGAWCKDPHGPAVGLTNYEKFIPGVLPELRHVAGLVADESSLLKTGGGVIKWNLIKSARSIPYKLSCTATPAPNEAMEYASQAAFLEKLRTEGEILWTYFTKTDTGYVIKPHARKAFYAFMASWSLYMRDPARFGFRDILSTLPAPEYHEYRLPITAEQRVLRDELLVRKGGGLFDDDRLGVKERSKFAQAARGFLYGGATQRIASHKPAKVAEIVSDELAAGRQVLVWTVFDEEGAIISELLNGGDMAAILHGSQTDQQRADILERFRKGDLAVLISKPQLVGYGLNLQHCRAMVFSGIDDSFERRYQAERRAVRFGQTETVRVHEPYIPELEGMMYSNVRRKEQRFLDDVALQERFYRDALGDRLPAVELSA